MPDGEGFFESDVSELKVEDLPNREVKSFLRSLLRGAGIVFAMNFYVCPFTATLLWLAGCGPYRFLLQELFLWTVLGFSPFALLALLCGAMLGIQKLAVFLQARKSARPFEEAARAL